MRRIDLRGRVTLASVITLAGGLLALAVATNLVLRSTLSSDASSVLRDRAAAQLTTVSESHGRVRVSEGNDAALDRQSWVFTARGTLERPAAPPAVQRAARALARVSQAVERDLGGAVRLRAEPVYARGGRRRIATAVVGVSLLPYRHAEHVALFGTAALGLFLLLIGTLATRRAVGAALRPVAAMTERAADWSEHDLHRRFDLGPPHDELTRLAATLDGMLGRIDSTLRHEQRFSSEMAHELRTPLSGLRAEAELGLRSANGDGEAREGMRRILAATDRMDSVIETLLTVARRDVARPAGSCDPFLPVSEVVGSLQQSAVERGMELELQAAAGSATVGADAEVVAQALHPLLENALRHGATRVTVSIQAGGAGVTIRVDDDGPGIDPADADSVFRPGTSTSGGAGLGLSLARRLARTCGGDVRVAAGAPGGRLELLLPGARSHAAFTQRR